EQQGLLDGRLAVARRPVGAGDLGGALGVARQRLRGWLRLAAVIVPIHEGAQQRIARRFAADAIVGDEEADVVLGQQGQQRVDPLNVAAVLNQTLAVDTLLVEAPIQAWHTRIVGEMLRVHLLRGGVLQDARLAEAAVLQVRDHEARHVSRRRAERSRRPDLHVFKRLRGVRAPGEAVARRNVAGKLGGQGLEEAAGAHAKRRQDVLLYILLERLPRHLLDDVGGEDRAIVGVRRELTRRTHARGNIGRKQRAERLQTGGVARLVPDATILEAGGVRQQ